jgi:hypothetical protein
MRYLLLLLAGVFTGCGDGALECGPGTHEEDGVCVPGEEDTDTDTDVSDDGHPLAPEKYKWIWNIEGTCETYNNRTGNQVYILAEDVRVEADGSLAGIEKWYWFQEGEGWDGDCVDTFEITGAPKGVDKAQYKCSECEESFEVSRKLVDAQCDLNYNYFLMSYDWKEGFPDDDPVDSYGALMLMDTLNPNGNPNEDNKMLVVQSKATEDGNITPAWVDTDFARGHAIPDDASEPGPPGTYDWLAEKCIRTNW